MFTVKQMCWNTKYVFFKIIWTLKLLDNQNHMPNQVVFQIWSWYNKNLEGFKVVSIMIAPCPISNEFWVFNILKAFLNYGDY